MCQVLCIFPLIFFLRDYFELSLQVFEHNAEGNILIYEQLSLVYYIPVMNFMVYASLLELSG